MSHTCAGVSRICKNPDSYGEICVGCNQCGRRLLVLSLFAGCGGLDLGLEQAGFRVVWANDNNHWACASHRSACPHTEVVEADVRTLELPAMPAPLTLVTGGFPCQGFSVAGQRRASDPRNQLYLQFVRAVRFYKPIAFLAENVKGLLTMRGGDAFREILADFGAEGYAVRHQVVNAADYGVPQDRERVLMVGVRTDWLPALGEFAFPAPTHGGPGDGLPLRLTLNDAIPRSGDPADAQAKCGWPAEPDVCAAKFSSRYMSRQRKRGWFEPSFTIPAQDSQVPLHPAGAPMARADADHWAFAAGPNRRLSAAECYLLQGFPDRQHVAGDPIQLAGPLPERYKQVGNAVPPPLARAVGEALKKYIRGETA